MLGFYWVLVGLWSIYKCITLYLDGVINQLRSGGGPYCTVEKICLVSGSFHQVYRCIIWRWVECQKNKYHRYMMICGFVQKGWYPIFLQSHLEMCVQTMRWCATLFLDKHICVFLFVVPHRRTYYTTDMNITLW